MYSASKFLRVLCENSIEANVLIFVYFRLFCRLSGLSPFMGDDDNETIQNVSNAEWDFEDEAFDVVSDMSKKFIEELLIRDPG